MVRYMLRILATVISSILFGALLIFPDSILSARILLGLIVVIIFSVVYVVIVCEGE